MARYKRYGLTKEQFELLVERAGGKCECCGKKFSKGREECIDHDHNTNCVRGILCKECNTGLGLLGDTKQGLIRAIKYLEREQVQGELPKRGKRVKPTKSRGSLDLKKVREIRKEFYETEKSYKTLGKEFNMSVSTIRNIVACRKNYYPDPECPYWSFEK
jgi:hypothetical protein